MHTMHLFLIDKNDGEHREVEVTFVIEIGLGCLNQSSIVAQLLAPPIAE